MFPAVSRSRLLPMSLPFRHFGAAVAFQVAAWALLLLHSGDLLSFEGGLGPLFAALHLVTLGVLAMTAMGASLQLLPVATRQPVRALWAVKLAWWTFVPGIVAFCAGAAAYRPAVMGAGALLVFAALGVFCALLASNLARARGMRVVVLHGWAALACLAGLLATALALVARYEHGIALDHAAFRSAHVVLATYGFMGLLAVGLSYFLLPMLALAPPPAPRLALAVLVVAALAIVLGALGLRAAGAGLGLAAALAHVFSMERSLRARMRGPLGTGLALVRLSWWFLLASLIVALFVDSGADASRLQLLFGLLLIPGWLLTFLLGVMQRIVPFLGSVHASSAPGGSPLISAMTPTRLLSAHALLHLGALAFLLLGVALGQEPFIRAGAAAGLAAAALFGAFLFHVVMKVRTHGNACPPSQPAPA